MTLDWVRSNKNLVSSETEECDVSINHDTSNETHQGPPDGTQGYLAACYRNTFDTKPSQFSKPNPPESGRKPSWKPKRAEWTEPKIYQLTKKKIPHTLFHYYLGWLIRWKVCITHERCRRNHNCRTKFQTKRVCFAQTLYQHQSALPYLGCCTLSSCSSTKGPRVGQKKPKDKGVEMYSLWSYCCWWCWLGVAPKKFGRPIKIKFVKY